MVRTGEFPILWGENLMAAREKRRGWVRYDVLYEVWVNAVGMVCWVSGMEEMVGKADDCADAPNNATARWPQVLEKRLLFVFAMASTKCCSRMNPGVAGLVIALDTLESSLREADGHKGKLVVGFAVSAGRRTCLWSGTGGCCRLLQNHLPSPAKHRKPPLPSSTAR